MRLFRAEQVAPVVRPTLRDGAVLVDRGRIVRVGPAASLARDHPRADQVDLGRSLLLPGLVNAHVHLELSDAVRPAVPGKLAEWLIEVIRNRAKLGGRAGEAATRAAEAGAAESLGHGVTCVGDITRFAPYTRAALARSPLRVVSFGEVQAMAARRGLLEERFASASDRTFDGWDGATRVRVAVSPHAPYTVEPDGYRRCVEWSRRHGRVLATHLAESAEEELFLAGHGGPLRGIWEFLGAWDSAVPRFDGGPVAFALSLGLLTLPTVLAHVNFVTDGDLASLARSPASVAYCPRTHAYFGHPPHRFREMMARGINVCLATDSRASSPDLNVMEDVRHVAVIHPDLAPTTLVEMVTTRAARALGVEADVGAIAPGMRADFVTFPAEAADAPERPVEAVVREPIPASSTWVNGEAASGTPASD